MSDSNPAARSADADRIDEHLSGLMGALDNPKVIASELAILNDPLTAEERPVIAELVAELHAASGVEEYSRLHTKLLVRYLARQRIRDELEVERTSVRHRIAALAAQETVSVTQASPSGQGVGGTDSTGDRPGDPRL